MVIIKKNKSDDQAAAGAREARVSSCLANAPATSDALHLRCLRNYTPDALF
jgi:hypothetical protein